MPEQKMPERLCRPSRPLAPTPLPSSPARPKHRMAPTNPHLHRFVQRERQVHQDMTGRILRDPNVYKIKMDDPLHELDQAKLNAELEKRTEKSRIAQNAPFGTPRLAQIDPRTAQIEPLYNVSITPTTKELPQTPAAPPGASPAAVPEKSRQSQSRAGRGPKRTERGKSGISCVGAAPHSCPSSSIPALLDSCLLFFRFPHYWGLGGLFSHPP